MSSATSPTAGHAVPEPLLTEDSLCSGGRRRLHPAVYVAAVSILIRVAWASWATVTPVSDFHGYDALAKQLLAGYFKHSMGYAFRTPGYPLFLALVYGVFGPSVKAAAFAQALMGGITSGLVVVLAMKTLSRRAGVIAGLLHAFSLTAVVYVPVLASENLAVFLLVCSLLALAGSHERAGGRRWCLAALSGVLFSALVLTRPACGVPMVPAFVLLALYHPHRRTWSIGIPLVFLVAAGTTFAPWSIRNHRLGMSPLTISTQGGVGLWWDVRFYGEPGNPSILPKGSEGLSEQERDRLCRDKALEWVRSHPGLYLRLCRSRLVRAFGASPDPFVANWIVPTRENDELIVAVLELSDAEKKSLPPAAQKHYANVMWRQSRILWPYGSVMAALVLAGVLMALPRWRAFAFVLLPSLAYLGFLVLTVFIERYREVTNPLMFVPAGALLADILFGTRDLGRWLPRVGKIVLAGGLVGASVYTHSSGLAMPWYRPPAPRFGNPDVGELISKTVLFPNRPESYLIPWTRSAGATATREGEGLRCEAAEGDKPRYVGIRFPADEPQAIRMDLTMLNPESVQLLLVDAQAEDGRLIHRWAWNNSWLARMDDSRDSYVFVPRQKVGFFATSGASSLDGVQRMQITAKVRPGPAAGFILHHAEVAPPKLSQPDASALNFVPIGPQDNLAEHDSFWNKGWKETTIERAGEGLRLHSRAPGKRDYGHYAGLRYALPQAAALRLRMRFENPQNIEAVYVDACTRAGERRGRWMWVCGKDARPAVGASTFVFVRGRDTGFFKAEETAAAFDQVCDWHVFIRVAPEQEAGFVIESVEWGRKMATPDSVVCSQPSSGLATPAAGAPADP